MDKYGKGLFGGADVGMAELQKMVGELSSAEKKQLNSMMSSILGVFDADEQDLFAKLGLEETPSKTTAASKPTASTDATPKLDNALTVGMIKEFIKEIKMFVNDETVTTVVKELTPMVLLVAGKIVS